MREITCITILILAAALIPACATNDGTGTGANTEASPAVSQSTEAGTADNSTDPEGANTGPSEAASNDAADNAGKKKEGPCGTAGLPTRRIEFPKGATEVTATGTMNGFDDKQVLLIDTRAGQELRIEDVGDNPVTLSVCDPDGENVDDYDLSCHGRFKLSKTKKGDYRVFVTECKKADPWKGEYRLKVTAVDAE